MKYLFALIFTVISLSISAQHTNLLLGKNYNQDIIKEVYNSDDNYHTSFKPIFKSNLNLSADSIVENRYSTNYKGWFLRKTYQEHFFILKGEDYKVTASPIINLSKGRELVDSKSTFTNTRGYLIEGNLGKTISFATSFAENQSIFPSYLDTFIKQNEIVPGQGYARDFKETGFDYAMSSGYVSYRANKMFAVQSGHGKHFIGDGYRSLLLSDNTFNYPYLRIQTTFGKVQDTNLYAEQMDIN
jgi:hypothetical protein